ncbi:tetratricopeptide repeat protein [Kistimonas asteriae]|uniref:tetratricopeptide repeat protein n=1 Tax=Kistimonas asteriae TaxID=517724 RepID=UPI001BAE11F7|nr:tetratricopeptide repeat protein [Kistimonas asteriae]
MQDLRQKAMACYRQGQFADAAGYFQQVIQASPEDSPPINDLKYLSMALYACNDYVTALDITRVLHRYLPDDSEVVVNLGTLQFMTGDVEGSLDTLQQLTQREPGNVVALDSMTHLAYSTRHYDAAKHYGRLSLEAKDAAVCSPDKLAALENRAGMKPGAVTEASSGDGLQVISYSLWGDNPVYLRGAVRNAYAALVIYPGWQCRFYCGESVPTATLQALQEADAELIMMPEDQGFFYGLFWRFLVADDPTVSRYIIRDVDSPLTLQERSAVDQWIRSGRSFHLIRDWYSHSELILAGLWGGIGGALPELQPLFNEYYQGNTKERTIDQLFLRETVWPYIRTNHVVHDDYFRFGNTVEFHEENINVPGVHIGQNWDAFLQTTHR